MKITIALLLCGIVYASASSRCSEEGFKRCNPNNERRVGDVETPEQLENMCRYSRTILDCEVDYMERCPNEPFSEMRDYMKEIQRVNRVFCDKSNPLRKKFLDNARCLNMFSKRVLDTCSDGSVVVRVHDEASCEKLKSVLKCSEQTVAENCGEDARQVYMVFLNPEFQLRTSNCM